MLQKEINYNAFLKLNTKNYPNKWIAMIDGKVVSSSSNFKETYREATRKFPGKRPLIAKIPSTRAMIL